MKIFRVFFFYLTCLLFPILGNATSCVDLDTDAKIKAFLKESQTSNPLLQSKASVLLELNPCEGELCLKKNKKKRNQLKQEIHLLQAKDQQRIFSVKGPDAPQCLIQKDDRQFYCAICDWISNEQCRSHKLDSSSSNTLRGTNINPDDFDLLEDSSYKATCIPVEGQDGYFQIQLTHKDKTSNYDQIIGFYEGKRGIPLMLHFYAKQSLRKVYRFFPKYYVKVRDSWIATAVRVRTVQGDEKKYVFETLIRVLNESKNKLSLYLDPANDPRFKGSDYQMLFQSN